jgi:hypothetical protein
MQYLTDEIDPVLAPIVLKLLAERPHGSAAIKEAIARICQEMQYDGSTLPWKPEHLNKEWLGEALGVKVLSCSIEKVGLGFTSDAFKITYQSTEGADKIAILKLPSGQGEKKQKAHALDCLTEVMFYNDFSKQFPLKICTSYSAGCDKKAGWHWNILMENMNTGGNVEFPMWMSDSRIYPNLVSEVVPAIHKDMAKMHAHFWRDEQSLSHEMFKLQPAMPGLKTAFAMASNAQRLWKPSNYNPDQTVGEHFWDLTNNQEVAGLDPDQWKLRGEYNGKNLPNYPTMELFTKRMYSDDGRKAIQYILKEVYEKRPHTFVHGDTHPGNIFWNPEKKEISWIDFQMVGRAPPGLDLAQSMLLVVDAGEGASIHKGMIRAYYAELTRLKPEITAEYSFETCWEDFRMGCLIYFCTTNVYMLDNELNIILPEMKKTNKCEMCEFFIMADVIPRMQNLITNLALNELLTEILAKC